MHINLDKVYIFLYKCVLRSMPHYSKNIEASCEKRVEAGAVTLYDKILFFFVYCLFLCAFWTHCKNNWLVHLAK